MRTDGASSALEALALADDVEVVRAAEHIYNQCISALGEQEIDPGTEHDAPVIEALVVSMSQDESVVLSDSESIATAHWVLLQLVKSPGGSRFVLHALSGWEDDTQRVGARLQWTLAGTLLLLVATTEVEFGPNGLHIHKKTVIP